MSERVSADEVEIRSSRRQFLGALGGTIVATGAVSGAVSAREPTTISMVNNHFDPVGLAVEPGSTVRFELDAGSHSATAYEDRIPSGATPFDSGTISEGGFEHTFETLGTYDYYCIPHESMGMTGRIVVGEPGGPAEASPIPAGAVPGSDEIVRQGSVNSNESDDFRSGGHGGMMRSGPEMMGDSSHSWRMLVPVGFLTTALGLAGGFGYWLSGQRTQATRREDSALATLKEGYARGDIDQEQFEQRLDQLNQDE